MRDIPLFENDSTRTHRDNTFVILLVMTAVIIISNLITYNVAISNTRLAIKASEKKQAEYVTAYLTEQLLITKTELLKDRSELSKSIDLLESKYYFLEGLLANAEKNRGYIVIEK